jgi:hypothetical protein
VDAPDPLDVVLALSPPEFERLVARHLERLGYTDMWVVGGAGELGVDVRASDAFGRPVVARCMRYRPGATVGSAEVQRFFDAAARAGAAGGVFVTTSSFTPSAAALARDRDVVLVTGDQLAASYQETEPERRRQGELLLELQRPQDEGRHGEAPVPADVVAAPEVDEGGAKRRQDTRRPEEAEDGPERGAVALVPPVRPAPPARPAERGAGWGTILLYVLALLPFAVLLVVFVLLAPD